MKVLVMTGATDGIGLSAVRRIVDESDIRIIVGSRSGRRTMPDTVEVLPLDLAIA